MDWPYKFPHPADVIAEEAERFRRLPPDRRVEEIVELADLANQMLAANPRRDAVVRLIEADEQAWREAQRRLFRDYGY